MIPAITLWQPWASLIACGAKVYETRAFECPTRLFGRRIAIHAAKKLVVDVGEELADELYHCFGCSWNYSLPRGAIVCTATIDAEYPAEDVVADVFGDYSPGRWAWRMTDIERIEPPIPAKGRQMIGWPWEQPVEPVELSRGR